MNIKVNSHTLEIEQNIDINAGEYNITTLNFEFSEEYEGLTKMAVFSNCETILKTAILDNQCTIPFEVLEEPGQVLLGVYGYEGEGEELELRYSPEPQYFNVKYGSYQNGGEPEIPPKSEWEQLVEEINEAITETNNLNISATKENHTTTITITHKDGTEQEVEILDGEKGEKGDKGDPGAVHMIVVQTLPTHDIDESAIYLVPLENPTEEGNNYAEYVYINNQWELLGKIGVQVDLTDYVKFTDYASDSTSGVIKAGNGLGVLTNSGYIYGKAYTYAQYQTMPTTNVISKATLDNVITGKGLVSNTDYATRQVGGVVKYGNYLTLDNGTTFAETLTNAQYQSAGNGSFISKGTLNNVLDARIGDINSVLDAINGENI